MTRLLDRDFNYVPSADTDVLSTWKKFGFKPTTRREGAGRIRKPAARVPRLSLVRARRAA